ncbi:MAG: hypothetical protein WC489_01835 [Patescibacteria group bacterium]
MNTFFSYIASRKILLFITVVFFLIRLPFLDNTFLLYDERDTVLTQYSLAKTGKDLYGNQTPVSFEHISPQAPVLAMYYGIPFWLLGLPQNVFTSRLIYLFPSSFIPLLVFEILFVLLKRKELSVMTALVFSFSPWVYHISRLALEINIAFPVLLLALLLQLKKRYLLSFFLYFISFFLYQGLRPLIPTIFLYFALVSLQEKKTLKNNIMIIVFFVLFFAVLLFFADRIEQNLQSRGSSEIVFLAKNRLKDEVDYARSLSANQRPIVHMIDNKVVLIADYLTGNTLQGINLSYLFKTGDYVPIYSNAVTGQFYPFMVILLFCGLFYLGKVNSGRYYLIAGCSIIGMISSIINIYSVSFSIRSLFSGIGISFIITLGAFSIYSYVSKLGYILKYSIFFVCGSIVVFQTGSFFYKYTFHRPFTQAELYHETERKLARFLIQDTGSYNIRLSNPFSYYLSYVFLQDKDYKDIVLIQNELQKNKERFMFYMNQFSPCNAKAVEFTTLPKASIIDEICLSDKTKKMLEYVDDKQYHTISYSDINPLRSGKAIKFYIFK